MNPSSENSTVVAKLVLLLFLAYLAAIYLINGAVVPSIAQSTERELENTVPKHLPIKLKIRKEKEKAFKDLKNEKWVRDFQLEVTNTGDKPIYYLSLLIILPEITAPDGHNIGFGLHYGRSELGTIEPKAEADDVPIKPGETYVFSFTDLEVDGWERFRQRENKPDAKKLILHFQILSFGDGTGYVGNDGKAVPHGPDAKSGTGGCVPEPNFDDSGGMTASQLPRHSQHLPLLTASLRSLSSISRSRAAIMMAV
ncbi:MAG TPA: hypothetical protein VGX92_11485 [Pyrinomonadaceae bacterium]|jgi:hypothetical protein|nr:hypothetical protein [Pyrinomonadaceae bacterium]